MKSKISIFIAIFACVVTSCLKNEIVYDSKNIDYRSLEFAGPIAKVHIPFYENMEKKVDGLFVNNQGIVSISYTYSRSIEWDETISIDDYFSSDHSTEWTFDLSELESTTSTYTGIKTYPVALTTSGNTGSYVKEAKLSAGLLELSFISDGLSSSAYEIVITIPGLTTHEGMAFSQKFSPVNNSPRSIPLTGYTIKTDDRHLNMICEITVNTGSPLSGKVEFDFSLSGMDVDYLSGYFGTLNYKSDDNEMEIDFFDKLNLVGTVGFKNIEMNSVVTNRTGLPMNVSADFIFTNETGLNNPLIFSPNPFYFSVLEATESGNNHVVTPTVTPFSTTLPEIEFEGKKYPSKLKFNVEGIANPDEDPDIENFIVKSNIDPLAVIDLTLIVPMHVKIENYSRKDTVDFDYNDIVGNDENHINHIEFMDITLTVDNHLPFNITLTADAIDAAGDIVEKEFVNNQSITAGNQIISVNLSQRQLEKFRTGNVKHIVLSSSANTGKDAYVQITRDDCIDIDVSVNFKFDIPSNIFE